VRAHETAAGEQTQVTTQVQENQSLPVRKKVQLGDSSLDALLQYKSLLDLHEIHVCSRHSTFVRVNEFHSFIVSFDYLLVAARNAKTKHVHE